MGLNKTLLILYELRDSKKLYSQLSFQGIDVFMTDNVQSLVNELLKFFK